jgi:hypothetical protein
MGQRGKSRDLIRRGVKQNGWAMAILLSYPHQIVINRDGLEVLCNVSLQVKEDEHDAVIGPTAQARRLSSGFTFKVL